jgi:UDP-N-acetylenolpyruvoylglucosamine reductase
MLHPCQTAARTQLLLQQQQQQQRCNSAAAFLSSARQEEPCASPASGTAFENSKGSGPASTAAAAAAVSQVGGTQCSAVHVSECDAQLLLYMRAWFSMVAGLLGIDMLPFFDAAA